jgi:hypothetical protein
MEHIVVAIRPGQGPGVVSWALRHARVKGGALEIIASGLEWPDPHGALRGVRLQLIAAGSDVPFAMRAVALGMPAALTQSASGVDLIVLGSRGDRLDRAEAAAFLSLASVSACPVVVVPASWRPEAPEAAAVLTEAIPATGLTDGFVERVCAGKSPIRIVPTSFVEGQRLPTDTLV